MEGIQEKSKGEIGIDDLARSLLADLENGETDRGEAVGDLVKDHREKVKAIGEIPTRSTKNWRRERVTIH